MAIATCPKCATKLKVPDGTSASVRCPKCQTVFKTSAPAPVAPEPQFEVVDEPTPPKAASKPAPKEVERPKSKARSRDDDDDDDDRPRKKRRDDDEDEDERPRSKKRSRDDDEEEDRPRKKRRDDDDDDDDRPRSKKRSRDDDDEDEDDRPRKKKKSDSSAFGLGRVGVLLVLISLGIYAGSMLMQLLLLFIGIVGFSSPMVMGTLLGVLGLGNWIVGIVGLGLCIAGPSRSRGLAIAALSVSAVHLLLGFIVATKETSLHFSSDHVIVSMSVMNRVESAREVAEEYGKEMQKNPGSARAKELAEKLKSFQDDTHFDADLGRFGIFRGGSKSSIRWPDFTSALGAADHFLLVLVEFSDAFEYFLLSLLWGLTEVARLILIILLIGSLGHAVKMHDVASKAKVGWIVAASASGLCLLLVLVVGMIMNSSAKDARKNRSTDFKAQMDAERSRQRWASVSEALTVGLHCGSLAFPLLAGFALYSGTSANSGGGKRAKPKPKKRTRRYDDDDDDDDD